MAFVKATFETHKELTEGQRTALSDLGKVRQSSRKGLWTYSVEVPISFVDPTESTISNAWRAVREQIFETTDPFLGYWKWVHAEIDLRDN
jgi:hypothetical protein